MISPKKNLTKIQRERVILFLLERSHNGILGNGDVAKAASKFECCTRTIYRVWKLWNVHKNAENVLEMIESRKRGNSGRKKVYSFDELKRDLFALPQSKRTTIRDIAASLSIANGTVLRLLRCGVLVKHNTRVKPLLKPKHLRKRLEFALARVHPITKEYESMENVVVIDEKIFYNDRDKKTMYLVEGEEPPERACENKRYIGSTMFLVAVARPR